MPKHGGSFAYRNERLCLSLGEIERLAKASILPTPCPLGGIEGKLDLPRQLGAIRALLLRGLGHRLLKLEHGVVSFRHAGYCRLVLTADDIF